MTSIFPENRNHWIKTASLVKKSNRIFISTHVNPDGDAIGSVMALYGFLTRMGKTCRIVNEAATPEMYRFLDPEGVIESYFEGNQPHDPPGKGDLVMALDLGNYSRLGKAAEFLVQNEAAKVVIDHHQPEQITADVIVINTGACSTASLVYDFMCSIDRSLINQPIAEALLTAVISDTGFFRYSNTNAITHRIAAELYACNVTVSEIRKHLESGQLLSRQKLLGLALAGLRTAATGKIAYSTITREMFEAAGASREHTEGIIEHIKVIKGTKIAFLIIQEGTDLYKASFRTTDTIPANEIASLLGGSGHPKAAGANIYGSLDEATSQVLEAATTILNMKEH